MKKILLVTTCFMFLLLGFPTVFADETGDVDVKYINGEQPELISVDITWGAMEFDYHDQNKVWDTTNHVYVADNTSTPTWSVHNNSNSIVLKNHSSKAVNATFTFTPDNGYSTVSGEFKQGSSVLSGALNLEKPTENVTTVKDYNVTFMPSGTVKSTHDSTSYSKVGSLTITIE